MIAKITFELVWVVAVTDMLSTCKILLRSFKTLDLIACRANIKPLQETFTLSHIRITPPFNPEIRSVSHLVLLGTPSRRASRKY